MRQVVLDTETTGLDWAKVINNEIGCVEILDRRISKGYFPLYNPCRAIDVGAQQVHGISADFLADKPVFQKSLMNSLVMWLMQN